MREEIKTRQMTKYHGHASSRKNARGQREIANDGAFELSYEL